MKTIRVKTDVFERGVIVQDVLETQDGIVGLTVRHMLDTQDQEIRNALIGLGWTPPEEGAQRRTTRMIAEKRADKRAHRIATMAAESLVRTEGVPNGYRNVFAIPPGQADEHLLDCIAHLEWHGLAASWDTEFGWVFVQLEPQDE